MDDGSNGNDFWRETRARQVFEFFNGIDPQASFAPRISNVLSRIGQQTFVFLCNTAVLLRVRSVVYPFGREPSTPQPAL